MTTTPPPLVYLDNAATSWPKPDSVPAAMLHYLRAIGASPGRSGHRLANEAERIRFDARATVAELFGVRDPMRVIFTCNGTAAINLVVHGLLPPGSHVITTSMEHNAVMRPLRSLEQRGVTIAIAACQQDGSLDPTQVETLIQPHTRLIVVNHASNVCGTILPIAALGEIARRHNIPLLVDAAQTAGSCPINLTRDGIDLLAFTGHKSLLGPPGTGGLVIRDDFDISRLPPFVCGGTGSRSEHESQPQFLPDKYEAGTPNTVGLAGLTAGLRYVSDRGLKAIAAHERACTRQLLAGLQAIRGVRVLGTCDASRQTAVVSFTVAARSVSTLAEALDEQYGILCRLGLHCAPQAHRTLGTLPEGTIRFAPGPFTTTDEIDLAVSAVRQLAGVQ